MLSIASFILFNVMLAMILPGINNKAIPLQFEQSERSPFFGSGTITLSFQLAHSSKSKYHFARIRDIT